MYPLTISFVNETKENLVHMGEVLDTLTILQTDATAIHPSYKPFDVNHKGDMSLQWKIKKKGCDTKKVTTCLACDVVV
jgi:hypothetical protein